MFVVTGGAGFIGSNIAAELAARNKSEVAIIDSLGMEEKWRNIAKLPLQAIVDPDETFSFLEPRRKDIQAIVHMGAISSTTEKDADLIARTNFTLSQKLWEFCSLNNIPFIYASSAATYGGGEQGFKDSFAEPDLSTLRPLNAYGWSKLVFDRWVFRKVEQGAAPPQWAGLKFFNVYGPNEYHKGSMQSVISHTFPSAHAGKACRLFKSYKADYENGRQLRDFVWVGDCVAVISWLISTPRVSGLLNVGSGTARSFADLASAVYRALDREPLIEYVEMPVELRAKYQYFTQADLSKLRASGYSSPTTSLEDGVFQYVRKYLRTDDRYL